MCVQETTSYKYGFEYVKGEGVQAYNFGNFDFEIWLWVEGEGQDTSRTL